MIQSALLATSTKPGVPTQPWNRQVAIVAILYLALYFLLDWASYVRPLLALGITPWNPQAGLTLAFLVFYGPRWLPVTAVAALLSEVLIHATPAPWPLEVTGSLLIALAYGLIALTLRRWQLTKPIHSAIDAARMAGILIVGTLIVAAIYIALYTATGQLPMADAPRAITRYWVADLNGTLTLTPLLLFLADNWRGHLRSARDRLWEVCTQFAALALVLLIIFMLPAAEQLRFFYLLFVPIIWIALRWRWPGAMLGVLAIQVGLIVAAEAEIPTARFIDLQFLMLTLSLTALLLGAVVDERAAALRQTAMREAEQRALLAMAPDAVLTVDARGHIQVANVAAQRMFGGQVDEGRAPRLSALLPALELHTPEGRATLDGRRADGTTFPAEVAWARLDAPANDGSLLTVRDVTDRRRAEEQLRERDAALARAMRFAVAGELASSLAHELNQPITALVSYLRASEILAAPATSADERLKTTLAKAAQEAIRASEVLRRLRDFYRGGSLKHEIVHVPTVCSAAISAFQDRLRRADATLAVQVDADIPTMDWDGTQLEIVLHNLLANAVDAVLQNSTTLRHIRLHGSFADDVITIRVEDSGPGLSDDIAGKLFEPFVTSKSDGMGLGLAISRSLVRARGGELSHATSSELGGAAFTIRLPIHVPAITSLV